MSNKKLSISLNILEAVIQILVCTSLSVTIMVGTLGVGITGLWKCFIVAIPVIITYVLRKFAIKFQVFTFINVLIVLSAFLLGDNYNERFFYVLFFFVIAVFSIRVKYRMIKYKEMSMQVSESAHVQGRDIAGRLKEHMFAGERIPMAFAGLMVFGYFAGYSKGSEIVINSQVIICILFVLAEIIYNHLSKLNDVYISNEDKSEFPAEQIKNVNIFTLAITCVLILVGMLVFYNGQYGNIFSVIGDIGMSGLRTILKGFIFLLGLFEGKPTDMNEMDVETEESTEGLIEPDDIIQSSHMAEVIAETVGVVLIFAAITAFVWFIVRYVRQLNRTKKLGTDTVEYIRPEKSSVRVENHIISQEDEINEQRNNKAARKYYKKRVKKGFGRKKPQNTYTPDQLTRYGITQDEITARRITDIYEKARYSDEIISDEELDIIKKTGK